jgi:hypothetical protein
MSRLKVLGIATLCLFVTSCGGMIMNRYSSYPQNNSLLKETTKNNEIKIKVADFTADYEAKTAQSCRMVGTINMPEKEKPYEVIRKALIDELILANLYSPDATKTMTAHIKKITFSTVDPKWVIDGTFDLEGKKVPLITEHKFQGGFVAVTACNNAVNAFMPSVQDFLYAFFKTDEFNQFIQEKKGIK